MSRTTCEHFVPIDLKCDKCDAVWETNIFELLHGYRNLVSELTPYLHRITAKQKTCENLESGWLDKASRLEQKFKKLK